MIRGITSDSGESNIEPRIAIFQDGVSISRSRGSVVELFDLERVEVAKGPQPTLFGRGALIGGVNVIQAKPEFEFSGQATAGIGNYSEVYLDGHVTGPIIEDTLAFRLAGRTVMSKASIRTRKTSTARTCRPCVPRSPSRQRRTCALT